MSVPLIIILVFALLGAMLMARAPVALALAVSGIAGIVMIEGPSKALRSMGSIPYQSVSGYTLIVIPMFVLMGMLVMKSGIATDLFTVASRLLRWLPGGLGVASIAVCAGFAAVTGSSVATVATLGRLCVTEMRKRGYNAAFASGILGAGGTLGVLIPPSIPLVIYGVLTGESIGRLMIAAVVPGVLTAVAYAAFVTLRARFNPALVNDTSFADGERLSFHHQQQETLVEIAAETSSRATRRLTTDESIGGTSFNTMLPNDRRRGAWAVAQVTLLFFIVIGGIYSGVFTATESGALGAFVALVLLAANRARTPKRLLTDVKAAFQESASLTAVIFAVLIGAGFLTYFLVISRIPAHLTRWITSIELPPMLIVVLFLILLLPLGMFLDSISIIVITVPLLYEPLMALGLDGIWLGILVVKLVEIGLITPPVGLNAFVLSGTVPDLQVHTVFKGLLPFVLLEICLVVMFLLFPEIVTFLPGLLR